MEYEAHEVEWIEHDGTYGDDVTELCVIKDDPGHYYGWVTMGPRVGSFNFTAYSGQLPIRAQRFGFTNPALAAAALEEYLKEEAAG